MKKGFTTFLSALKANTPPCKKGLSSRKFLSLFLILFLAVGNVWAASSVIPLTPDYKDIFSVATDGTYTFTCSTSNITSAANAESSWIGWYSTQSSFKEYNKSDSKNCMGVQTSIPNLKYDKIYFYIQNCSSFEIQGWANGDNRTISYSYQATDVESPTDSVFTVANKKACGTSGEIELNASKKYIIVVWNSSEQEIGVTYMVFNSSAPATTYTVNYNANGGSGEMAQTTNEIVASTFTAPSGKMFKEWNTAADGTGTSYAAGDEVTDNLNLYAIWEAEKPKYDVTYSLNGGTGTAPTQGKVAENGTFTVASAEGITPPTGKEFAGWSDGTNTYAAGATYTMGAAAVTFTAQWKAAPTVLFDWTAANSSNIEADNTDLSNATYGTLTVGTSVAGRLLGTNTMAKSSSGYKLGNNDVCIEIQGTSAFEEGDIVVITGKNGDDGERSFAIAPESATAANAETVIYTNTIATATDNSEYKVVITATQAGTKMRVFRLAGKTMYVKSIKVIRPAQKEILSEDITLSAVTVNTEAISDENLATLKTDPYKLDLTSEYAEAPTIAFTKQTVITYEDATTKTKTEAIEVVADKVDGKWQAQEEINGVTYTVTAIVPATYTVIYKDGETELASEIVKVGEHPTAEGVETKPLYALSWKLAEEVVELANVNGTADQVIILTAVWTPKYAATIDFTTYVQEERLTKSLADVLKDGNHNYICGGTFNNSEWGATSEDAAYQGYKFKDNGVYIEFLLQSGKRATFLFGNYGSTGTIKVGTAEAMECTLSDSKYVVNATSEDVLVRFTTGGTSTVTLKSITIGDIPAISDDATLKDLKVNGTTIAGFKPEIDSYYIEMPYGTQKADLPLVTATVNHTAATVTVQDAKDRPDDTRATIKVTAEDGTEKYYYVYFTNATKEGVNLVKATIGDKSIALVANESYIKSAIVENSGVNGRDGGVSAGSKFQKNSYIKIEMPAGQQFKANDIVDLEVTGIGGTYKLLVYSENSTEAEKLVVDEATAPTLVVGHNKVQLNKDAQALYLVRDGSNNWNPHVASILVQRDMAPFIESFVIGDAVGTINQTNKTIAIEVPASADVTALEPTIVAWANGSATVTPTGAQDFTNPVTYSVTSAYAEDGTTEYTVTVTKAVPSADATLATLTYNGTNITLEADQYNYEVELPKGTVDVPTVTYTTNNAGATVVKTDAAVLPGATTIIVTAEDGTTQQNYTINFTVSTSDIITIFDGSTMSNIATSPSGAISWEIVGSTMGAGDKNISYNDVTYTRALSCGNSSAMKHLKIVVADNNKAQFEIIGMSNSSSDTRHAWLTNSTDKGEFANAIAGLTSDGYNPAKFTTDWLEEGTYYLHSDNTVAILLIRVKAEPVPAKCEAPTISGLADVAVCDLSSALLDGTATVSDGGTVTYKWYAEGDAETVLATTATYAPTTVGNYYVVATNSLADHRDNSTTSSVVVVRIKTAPVITTEVLDQHAEAGNNVTLSVVATDAESYQWYTCDDAAGTNPVEVVGATNASLEVAVTSGMSQYYKVIISNTCGSAETVAKVEEWTELPQANVTESITWDWTVAAMDEVKTADGNTEYLMANVSSAVPNNENFRSDMLLITAQYANRGASNQFFQGTKIRFNTTVDGLVRVYYRSTGSGKNVEITINGISAGSGDAFQWSNYIEVPAGEVTIVGTGIGENATGLTRIQKIEFLAVGYTRDNLNPTNIATICLPNGGIMTGATLYKMAGKNEYNKLCFDEVQDNIMVAGNPYLFVPENGNTKINVYYTDELNAEAGNDNGLYGTYVRLSTVDDGQNSLLWGKYIISNNKYIYVDANNCNLAANRAYIVLNEVQPLKEQNPAPGLRRIVLGTNESQVATGVDQVQGDEVPTKMIINGQLFILRGEKMYDAQGKLVK